jgi:hypothetical protein
VARPFAHKYLTSSTRSLPTTYKMDYQAPAAGAGGRGCYNCKSNSSSMSPTCLPPNPATSIERHRQEIQHFSMRQPSFWSMAFLTPPSLASASTEFECESPFLQTFLLSVFLGCCRITILTTFRRRLVSPCCRVPNQGNPNLLQLRREGPC